MATETLEERLQRIEDIEAIRLLKHRYCAFCDDNYDADGIAALFTENAVWDAGPLAETKVVKQFGNISEAPQIVFPLLFIRSATQRSR